MWPYLVDTRRTIDPDYEVTKKERSHICNKFTPQNESNPTSLRNYSTRSYLQANEIFQKNDKDLREERESYSSRRFNHPCHTRAKTADKIRVEPLEKHKEIEQSQRREIENYRDEQAPRPRLSRSQSVSDICYPTEKKPASYAEIHLKRRQQQPAIEEPFKRKNSASQLNVESSTARNRLSDTPKKKEVLVPSNLSNKHAHSDIQIRSQNLIRPTSAVQPLIETPKIKENCIGYQNLVKDFTERTRAEEKAEIKTPKKVKPYETISTYADNYSANWSQRTTCKKLPSHTARVIDSARAAPVIPWHNISSSNMQFLSKVDQTGGGRKLFHKQVHPLTLGVRFFNSGQSVLSKRYVERSYKHSTK